LKLLTALVLVAVGLITALGLAAPPAVAGPNCTVDASIDGEEQEFLRLINDYRGQNGLAALALSDSLASSAAWKSQNMATEGYFAHDDTPIGRTWDQRLRDCGYTYNTWLGENIAAGNGTAAATFQQWRNSSGHNANMLNANYNAIGIGRAYVAGSPYGWYWTTDFGGVADAPSQPPASYPCADFNGDGRVLVADILFVVDKYQTADPVADIDHDGVVHVSDILVVVTQYFSVCPV
jgi:uncharacterized protein YkwD